MAPFRMAEVNSSQFMTFVRMNGSLSKLPDSGIPWVKCRSAAVRGEFPAPTGILDLEERFTKLDGPGYPLAKIA